jgi:glycosyltransferase involved in cell wall biosynthesis
MSIIAENRTQQTGRLSVEGTPDRFPLTAIILTRNEADNIGACLSALDWVEEVILVDSESTDETIRRAQEARPNVRVFANPFQDFGTQRNWAIDETSPKHEWALFLDADEECNEACARAIRQAVESPGAHVGFFLTCRNYFLGQWIKRATLYPSWQLRLMKLGCVRYRKEGHGQREVTDGLLGYVECPYDHYGFSKGIAHWIERHNRYSTDEVGLILGLRREPLQLWHVFSRNPLLRRRCLKRLAARVGFRPILRFLYTYIVRRAFLDGRAGFLFCLLRAAHEIHIMMKIAEAESLRSGHPGADQNLAAGSPRIPEQRAEIQKIT